MNKWGVGGAGPAPPPACGPIFWVFVHLLFYQPDVRNYYFINLMVGFCRLNIYFGGIFPKYYFINLLFY